MILGAIASVVIIASFVIQPPERVERLVIWLVGKLASRLAASRLAAWQVHRRWRRSWKARNAGRARALLELGTTDLEMAPVQGEYAEPHTQLVRLVREGLYTLATALDSRDVASATVADWARRTAEAVTTFGEWWNIDNLPLPSWEELEGDRAFARHDNILYYVGIPVEATRSLIHYDWRLAAPRRPSTNPMLG